MADPSIERKPRVLRVWRVGDHWCVVAENGLSFYLGYVSLPEGHPWRAFDDYDHIPADAHGGITFAAERDWAEFDSDDGVPPGFYVGFDCGHYCCTPIPGSYMARHWYPVGVHEAWDIERVVREVNMLAGQAEIFAIAGVVEEGGRGPSTG